MSSFARALNALALLATVAALALAFYYQSTRGGQLCPLCLLQRAALVAVGMGFLLNLRFGASPAHYGVSLLSALVGALVTVHLLLTAGAGATTLGAVVAGHPLSTWAFAFFTLVMVLCGVMLLFETQFDEGRDFGPMRRASLVLAGVFALLVLGNVVSGFLQCGFSACPAPSVAPPRAER